MNPTYLVFLVNDEGRRASTCILRYAPGCTLNDVRFNAGTTFARFVILREEDMVQVYASHPEDSNGAYLPHGQTR